MDTLTKYLSVAAGGALGAVLRYYLSLSGLSRIAQPFPAATFVINVTGSFVIGFVLTLATERIPINPHLRLALVVGFVGAYTTFSTFEYETARLIEGKDFVYAFLYVSLSFAIGFGAVWAGMIVAREVQHVPLTLYDVRRGERSAVDNAWPKQPGNPELRARAGLSNGPMSSNDSGRTGTDKDNFK